MAKKAAKQTKEKPAAKPAEPKPGPKKKPKAGSRTPLLPVPDQHAKTADTTQASGKKAPAVLASKAKAQDAYEFALVLDENTVTSLVRQLTSQGTKQSTLKALKQLSELMENAPQDAGQLGSGGANLASRLLEISTQGKVDKELKLYAAQCIIYLLRMYAPEMPYEAQEKKMVFRVLLWALDRLSEPEVPTFLVAQAVLQVTQATRLYLLLLDLEDAALLASWCSTLLAVARDDNLEVVAVPLVEMLSDLMLEAAASEVLGQVSAEALLKALVNSSGHGPAIQKVACKVLQRAEQGLLSTVLPILDDLLACDSASTSHLKTQATTIIVKVAHAAPTLLLPLLPRLIHPLGSPVVDRRASATNMFVSLLCARDNNLAVDFPDLLQAGFERFIDTSAVIRLQMLEAAPQLMLASRGAVQDKVVACVAERLQYEEVEKVRMAAVAAAAAAATAHPNRVPPGLLTALRFALRDSSSGVKREALGALVGAFRTMAGRAARVGSVPDSINPLLLSFPGHVAALAHHNSDLKSALHTVLAAPGLLPANCCTSVAAANVWALVWGASHSHGAGKEGLLYLARQKRSLATQLSELLFVRKRLRAKQAPDSGPDSQEKLAKVQEQLVAKVSATLLGSGHTGDSLSKAVGQLTELLDLKDLRVYERLLQLCDPLIAEAEARAARKDVVERTGSKKPLGRFVAQLTAVLLPSLFSPAAIAGLMSLACPIPGSALGVDEMEEAGVEEAVVDDEQGAEAVSASSPAPLSTGSAIHTAQLAAAARQLLCQLAKQVPALLVSRMGHAAAVLIHAVSMPQEEGKGTGGQGAKRQRRGKQTVPKLQATEAQEDTPSQLAVLHGPAVQLAAKLLAATGSQYRALSNAQGVKPPTLPPGLLPVLHRLCLVGGPTVARDAATAVAHLTEVLQPEVPRATAVQALASSLAQQLNEQGEEEAVPPCGIVFALCALAALDGRVLEEHGVSLAEYITTKFIVSDLALPAVASQTDHETTAWASETGVAGKMYQSTPAPVTRAAPAVIVKARVLRALARACSAPPLSGMKSAVLTANILLPVLHQLLDLDSESELSVSLGCESNGDGAEMRLSAAKALLRITTELDTRVPAPTYALLALVMQDPDVGVRAGFGIKLAGHLHRLMDAGRRSIGGTGGTGADWLPAKYAAAWALAAVDPELAHRTYAARCLNSYCVNKRSVVEAALARSAGGNKQPWQPTLLDLPEFMLPHLIYLLATHPDCPDIMAGDSQDSGTEELSGQLQPFSNMLQAMLEPLLLTGHGPQANLPLICKLFHTLKHTSVQEAVSGCTERMRALCDLGMLLTHAIVARPATTVASKSTPPEDGEALESPTPSAILSQMDHPAQVKLPKQLFDCTSVQVAANGAKLRLKPLDHLPLGFVVRLDADVASLWGAVAQAGSARKVVKRGVAAAKRTVKGEPDKLGQLEVSPSSIGGGAEPGSKKRARTKEAPARSKGSSKGGSKKQKAPAVPARTQPARAGRPTHANLAVDMEDSEASGDDPL